MLFYETLVLSLVAYVMLAGISRRYVKKTALLTTACVALVVYCIWGLARFAHAPLRPLATALAGTWIFLVLLALAVGLPWLLLLGLRALVRCFQRPAPSVNGSTQSRRDFIATIALPTVGVTLGGLCVRRTTHELVVFHRTFTIRNWPNALDGFRIGQITDTHVGDFISPDWVAHAVGLLNAADVHLQVMTGDLIDDLAYLNHTFGALEQCRAPLGMLCVLGNHEKMRRRLEPILAAYAERRPAQRIRLLVDESLVLNHNGTRLQAVGIDYPMLPTGRYVASHEQQAAFMRRSADRAFASVDKQEGVLCLSHHPDFFRFAQQRGAHLTLSGHTHGGHCVGLNQLLLSGYEFRLGRYQLGDSHLYVSGGTGHWLPLRYGVPMEVTVITIRSGAASA